MFGNISKAVSTIGYQAKGLTQAGAQALASNQMPKGALDKLKVANAVAGTAKSHAKGYVSKAGSFVGAGGAVAGAVSGGTLESEMRKAAIVADYIPMVGGTLSRGLRIGAKYAPKVASTAEVMAGQALQRPRVRLPDSSCDDRGISQTSPV